MNYEVLYRPSYSLLLVGLGHGVGSSWSGYGETHCETQRVWARVRVDMRRILVSAFCAVPEFPDPTRDCAGRRVGEHHRERRHASLWGGRECSEGDFRHYLVGRDTLFEPNGFLGRDGD